MAGDAAAAFAKPIVQELEDCVCQGSVSETLETAKAHWIALIAGPPGRTAWFNPGVASRGHPMTQMKLKQKVEEQRSQGTSEENLEIVHGGSLAQICMQYRACNLGQLDLRRMKYLAELIGTNPTRVAKALGTINVQGNTVLEGPAKEHGYSTECRRLDLDAAVDMAILMVYWSRDSPAVQKILEAQLNNLLLSSQFVGATEAALELERFERYHKEDQQKDSMGRSAVFMAKDLLRLLGLVPEADKQGKKDGDVAAAALARKDSLGKNWKSDTCDRCLPHKQKQPKTIKNN